MSVDRSFPVFAGFLKRAGAPRPGRAVGGCLRPVLLNGRNPVWVIRGRQIGGSDER